VKQVVLKQFRDAAQSTRACYRTVVEVPVQLSNVSLELSFSEWQVTLTPLDSYPIGDELGVVTGPALLSFEFEADMILEPGVVVAP
jgi:hypothetical protein